MTNRERRILRGEPITPKTLDEKSIKEAVANAKDTYDIAFTADIATDPTKPTVATTASIADAVAAHKNGKILRASIDFGDGVAKYGAMLSFDPTAGEEEIIFNATAIIGTGVFYLQIAWDADGAKIVLAEIEIAT